MVYIASSTCLEKKFIGVLYFGLAPLFLKQSDESYIRIETLLTVEID